MKKEKQIKTYQRRTKSGKMVTVKAHSAKYEGAEAKRSATKKEGAGEELKKKSSTKEALSERSKKEADLIREQLARYGGDKGKEMSKEESSKKKAPTKQSMKKSTAITEKTGLKSNAKTKAVPSVTTGSGVSSSEFKAWYHDPKSKEGKVAAKKLKAQVGPEKYKEMNKKANDSYSTRGHLSMFKGLPTEKTSTKEPTSREKLLRVKKMLSKFKPASKN